MGMYLLKFSSCLLVFWLVYMFLLERQKMHQFKRFYLLGSIIVSLIIPLSTITYYIEPVITDFEALPMYIPIEPSFNNVSVEETSLFSLEAILWLIYGFGVLLLSIRFAYNLIKLYQKISRSEKIAKHSLIYVLLKESRIPHSFFKYIFLNKLKFEKNDIPKEVILHEETHAKQLHSLDIVLLELLQIIFWFHPLIYILKHHIRLNHEFLADQAVLEYGADSKDYQNILLQFSSSTQEYQLSSAINYSSSRLNGLFSKNSFGQIKKRFTVMKTQTSKTRIWLSTLLLLPIIAILFYSFSEKEYVERKPAETSEISLIQNKIKNKGATETMMQEYNNWIIKFNTIHQIDHAKYERIVAIYNMMTEEQRNTVESYPVIPDMNLSKVKSKAPTQAQFESWKDKNKFAIWLDGRHVSNSELNNYKISDIAHFVGSKVHKNARSTKFPQPFQYSLYTKEGFKKFYQETTVKKYKASTKTYTDAIKNYLKGSQTNNSELRILKAQADKIYNLFTEEELKKHSILPPPPVPAEKKVSPNKAMGKKTKGGPRVGDTQQDTYNPTFLEYIMEMEKKGASFYLDDVKITAQKAKSIAKTNKGKRTEMLTQKDTNGKYVVKLSSPKLIDSQEKASKKQVDEYNRLAKKYNDAPKNKMVIKFEEQKRIEYLYGLMSDEQKKNAQPYPNFPPKPQIVEIKPPTPPKPKYRAREIKEVEPPAPPKVIQVKEIPNPELVEIPPPPPAPESTLDFVTRMAKTDAKFFSEGKTISSDKAVKLLKNNPKLNVKAQKTDTKQPLVYISKKPILIGIKGKSPLIYVNKKMPKKGRISLTKEEFKKLKITLSEGKVVSFKLKIPSVKTDLISGNSISGTSIKNLEKFEKGMITLFDIKDNNNSKLPPVIIELKK
ncbi:M56 family metallopeptidase [Winogradskyella luteola]|uniref:M56 family metallopeptidase n=1 Tax=Winogradskyella luteola TaxID=2828330 RepID=A0A9X1FAJ6_9FLAO|nr:M56 family metallopeptidase [Winogradskyella luteola]MBV7269608.1 M56 family metallopeptidase [Winogradskyella luteola]